MRVSLGPEIPEGYENIDIFRMLMRCLGGVREKRKRRQKYNLAATVELIRNAKKILVLTGAGISVSCGIPDFRSRDGLYAKEHGMIFRELAVDFPELPDPQSMFCLQFFRHDPRPFFRFAKEIFPGNFSPSPSHHFIAHLEKLDKLKRLYSQNIDGLERQAGINKCIQCHGHMYTAHCLECKAEYAIEDLKDDIMASNVPRCSKMLPEVVPAPTDDAPKPEEIKLIKCNGVIKPDIVFFGESLPKHFHRHMADDKDDVDLLIVMGSSLKVGPVNDIPDAIGNDVPRILINREPLPHISEFEAELLGNCDEIVAYIAQELGYPLPNQQDRPFSEHNLEDVTKRVMEEFAAEEEKRKLEREKAEKDRLVKIEEEREKEANLAKEENRVPIEEPEPKRPKLDGECQNDSDQEEDDEDDGYKGPLITLPERAWMADPSGFRSLFHGIEMPLGYQDSSSDEEEEENPVESSTQETTQTEDNQVESSTQESAENEAIQVESSLKNQESENFVQNEDIEKTEDTEKNA